jgi:hypothetical protein
LLEEDPADSLRASYARVSFFCLSRRQLSGFHYLLALAKIFLNLSPARIDLVDVATRRSAGSTAVASAEKNT